ncbi:multidrug resistance protein B [Planococcus antarcticus DSM 14505]|uniref:Multidrug resistance protein B n=1 Tax=Planococcus antarcticus DSM 14505 TaxID=1185653 RepID=A0AA87IPI7_9BACL|nr:multidrug resistance protein B [Planococcus antarcticus DSM 14505]
MCLVRSRETPKKRFWRYVTKEIAGTQIGRYHVWTSVAAALAVIATGYLVDFLTIASIFYVASLVFAWSGLQLLKLEATGAQTIIAVHLKKKMSSFRPSQWLEGRRLFNIKKLHSLFI